MLNTKFILMLTQECSTKLECIRHYLAYFLHTLLGIFNSQPATVNAFIGVAAFILTLWTFISNRSERRDKIKHSKKAELRAERLKKGNLHYLKIHNNGQSEARNIEILINDKPISSWEEFELPLEIVEGNIIKRIFANSFEEIYYNYNLGDIGASWKITITWSDDSGKTSQYQGVLS